jgi:hypothetical protein
MNIALYGNCQTRALFFYIKKLQPNANIKWICPDLAFDKKVHVWAHTQEFEGKFVESLYNVDKSIDFIKQSDVVIYQNIDTARSPQINQDIIKKHAKQNVDLISISSYYYDSSLKNPLDGMISRESKLKVSISSVELIIKNSNIHSMEQVHNHPNVHYFIDLCESICSMINWKQFSENDKKELLEEGYPFG